MTCSVFPTESDFIYSGEVVSGQASVRRCVYKYKQLELN